MLAVRPGCEHLVNGDVSVLEPNRRREQVQLPDALALGADQSDRPVTIRPEVGQPAPQRERVVVAQRLDVADLETDALQRAGDV